MTKLLCALALGLMIGCAAQKPVIAPIPNQTSTLDGQVYRGLRDVQAALDAYKLKVADGSFHPTPVMAADMSTVTDIYNDTCSAWNVYHAAGASAQASTAAALQAKYQTLTNSYQTAITSGAPLPPASTLGAK